MSLGSYLRPLGAATLVVLALVSGPASLAQATANRTERQCTAGGYRWDPVHRECWDRWCPWSDGHYYHPGETKVVGDQAYMCDGATGQFIPIGIVAQPGGPATGQWTTTTWTPTGNHSAAPIGPVTTTTLSR